MNRGTQSARSEALSAPAVIAFLAMLLFVSPSRGEDWPGWRGPRGDATSHETNVPLHWSGSDNIAWKTPVPGVGRSSPIVVGQRVFLTTGEVDEQTRRVLCFDRDSGRPLWNKLVHQGAGGMMHRFNTTASSTPAGDGERVYAAFVDDHGMRVVALDLQGEIVWSVSPGTFHSQHGFAASPVLYGEGVIVNGHQDGEAFVVMLDRRSGQERWRFKPAVNQRSFSTPVLTRHDGEDQLILAGASQTVAISPATGKRIWFAAGPAEKFVSTPAVGEGMVFSFGGSPKEKAMAIRLGGRGDVLESHVVWRAEKGMPYIPSPILLGEHLHVVNDQGIYSCLDPKTGDARLVGRKFGPVCSSPVSVAGRIYFFEDSGKCTVIENGPGFEVLATNELDEAVYATPAVSAGSLFVRTEAHLLRISEQVASQ